MRQSLAALQRASIEENGSGSRPSGGWACHTPPAVPVTALLLRPVWTEQQVTEPASEPPNLDLHLAGLSLTGHFASPGLSFHAVGAEIFKSNKPVSA